MRTRGFLASVMLEVAPGVYTSPRMPAAVRERVWAVVTKWHATNRQGSVLMTFPKKDAPSGQQILTVGIPPKLLVEHYGLVLVCKPK